MCLCLSRCARCIRRFLRSPCTKIPLHASCDVSPRPCQPDHAATWTRSTSPCAWMNMTSWPGPGSGTSGWPATCPSSSRWVSGVHTWPIHHAGCCLRKGKPPGMSWCQHVGIASLATNWAHGGADPDHQGAGYPPVRTRVCCPSACRPRPRGVPPARSTFPQSCSTARMTRHMLH